MSSESPNSYPNNRGENWISYRESPPFKRGVEQLETLEGVIPQCKVLILAVALNLKKAAEIDLNWEETSPEMLEQTLSNLGVYFYRSTEMERMMQARAEKRGRTETIPVAFYLIGASPDTIGEAMEQTLRFTEGYKDHEAFGEAMDFPSTAITAWQEFIDTDDGASLLSMNDERLTDEEKAFKFFRFSKEHWEDEVQWIEQIIAGVKMYSPKIYQQVMSSYLRSN